MPRHADVGERRRRSGAVRARAAPRRRRRRSRPRARGSARSVARWLRMFASSSAMRMRRHRQLRGQLEREAAAVPRPCSRDAPVRRGLARCRARWRARARRAPASPPPAAGRSARRCARCCSGGMPGPVSWTDDPHQRRLGRRRDVDAAAARRVAERVGDQVRERPGELGLVAVEDARSAASVLVICTCFSSAWIAKSVRDALDERRDVDPLAARRRSPSRADAATSRNCWATSCRRSTSSCAVSRQPALLARGVPAFALGSSSTAMRERRERRAELVRQAWRRGSRAGVPGRAGR